MLLQTALLHSFLWLSNIPLTSQVVQVVKNPPANAGDARDADSKTEKGDRFHPWVRNIPWGREWQPTPVFLAWKIPWTEEPSRLQSTESQSQTRLSMRTPRYSTVYTPHLISPFVCWRTLRLLLCLAVVV